MEVDWLKSYFKERNKAYCLQKCKPTSSKDPAVLSSFWNAKPAATAEQGVELETQWK